MRLISLKLQDFLGHRETVLTFEKPVTMIQGENGAGKSSIRDALLFALTGRCRSTDRGGRLAHRAIRSGCSEAVVRLTVQAGNDPGPDSVMTIERSVTPKGSTLRVQWRDTVFAAAAAQARLDDLLGVPADFVEMLFHAPTLFDLDGAERSQVLAAALDVRMTEPGLAEIARAQGVGESAIETIMLGVRRFRPPELRGIDNGGGYITTDVMDEVYRAGYEKRTAVNAELRKLRAMVDGTKAPSGASISDDAIARSREGMAKIEAGLAKRREALGAARETARIVAGLKKQLAGLKSAPAQEVLPEPVDVIDPEAFKRLDDARDEFNALRDGQRDLERAAREAEQEIDRLTNRSTICPSVCAPRECPYLKEEAEQVPADRIAALQIECETASAKHREAQSRMIDLNEQIQSLTAVVEAHRAATMRAQAQQSASAASSDQKIAELEATIAGYGDVEGTSERIGQEVVAAENEITAIRAGLDLTEKQQTELRRWQETTKAIQECEADAEVIDEAVRALAPTKIPAAAAQMTMAPMIDRVNATLAAIIPSRRYGVDAAIGKSGLELVPWTADSANRRTPLAIENLSTSERLRLGVAVAAALSVLTGIGVVVVDDIELLTQANREAVVFELISYAELGYIANAILIESKSEPTVESDDVIAGYWLADSTLVER